MFFFSLRFNAPVLALCVDDFTLALHLPCSLKKKTANNIQNLTLCGWKFGKICQKRRSEEKSKSGLSKNRSLTMLENCVVFTSLIQQMKNSMGLRKMGVESWKFRCQQQCLAEYREKCNVLDNCETKYACIVEADDSTRKRMEGTLHKGHEDHIAGR